MTLACTTIERVQAYLDGVEDDADATAWLEARILAVSKRFERYCFRHFEQVERTEEYQLRPRARIISLRGAPVLVTDGRGVSVATFTVKASTTLNFSGAATLTRNTNYIIEQEQGILRILDNVETARSGLLQRSIAPAYFQVRYTGGLAADTDELIDTYPDLAAACDVQVVYEWKRRTDAGAGDQKAGDSTSTHTKELALLAGVEDVLKSYRRRRG